MAPESRPASLKKQRFLSQITVRRQTGQKSRGIINAGGQHFFCALGRGGISARKREGDGATPLATMAMISGFQRPQYHALPRVALQMHRNRKKDGWCDAVGNGCYNRAIQFPFAQSAETMLRNDALYDVGFVLDWNYSCRKQGAGSAIFLHIARQGYLPTEGCIALSKRDMERLMPYFSRRTKWRVVR